MINIYAWLDQPQEVRKKLAEKLKINKSGGVILSGGRLECDGHTSKDLYESVTVEKMQEYTGSKETDVNVLFNLCVKKCQEPEVVPEPEIKVEATPKVEPKKRGRKVK